MIAADYRKKWRACSYHWFLCWCTFSQDKFSVEDILSIFNKRQQSRNIKMSILKMHPFDLVNAILLLARDRELKLSEINNP